jgi:nicotinamidase-related amidase
VVDRARDDREPAKPETIEAEYNPILDECERGTTKMRHTDTDPDYTTAALITIDVQCDTLDGQPFEIPGTSQILPKTGNLLLTARKLGLPIIHMVRTYQPDGSNVDLCRRALIRQGAPLLLAGSPSCELAPELRPTLDVSLDTDLLLAGGVQPIAANEMIIYKPRWGAFYQTPLEAHLHQHGVSTLIVTSCNFPNCPRTSIYEASERDYQIVAVEDGISGLCDQGKQELGNIGVQVLPSQAIIAALHESAASYLYC